jgi:hypothetical protein
MRSLPPGEEDGIFLATKGNNSRPPVVKRGPVAAANSPKTKVEAFFADV